MGGQTWPVLRPAPPKQRGARWQRASAEEKLKGVGVQNNLEFEALNKPSYQLAQAADGDGDVDESFSLSVVDMAEVLARPDDAAARSAFASALGASLETIGFAVLVGHGVPAALHEEAHRRTPRLFTETSEEDKAAFRAERFGAVNQGWFPREETSNLRECKQRPTPVSTAGRLTQTVAANRPGPSRGLGQ